jgi:hypothetical protein
VNYKTREPIMPERFGENTISEISQFFVEYDERQGKRSTVLNHADAERAMEIVREATENFSRK